MPPLALPCNARLAPPCIVCNARAQLPLQRFAELILRFVQRVQQFAERLDRFVICKENDVETVYRLVESSVQSTR